MDIFTDLFGNTTHIAPDAPNKVKAKIYGLVCRMEKLNREAKKGSKEEYMKALAGDYIRLLNELRNQIK